MQASTLRRKERLYYENAIKAQEYGLVVFQDGPCL